MDTLFHYYATYLTARLAGMEQQMAQRLAYFCYGMTELEQHSEAVKPWVFEGLGDDGDRAFAPCVVSCDDDASQFGPFNCKLTFTQLPCLTFGSGKVGADGDLDFHHNQAFEKEMMSADFARMTSRWAYNPLTDIDWRGGGEVKTSFGRKIAAKLGGLRRQAMANEQRSRVGSNYYDPRLRCIANSEFARAMLNDSIERKNTTGGSGLDPLALFGCRLFVYQRTWLHGLSKQNHKDKDKVQTYLAAFYWSAYAIQSYLSNKPVAGKLRIRLLSDSGKVDLLNSILRSIFVFDGNKLEQEYFYLSRLGCILSYGEVKHRPSQDVWYQGLRLRPDFLLEQALIASGGGCSRKIQFLSAFKQSDFYYLNKAAQSHSMWLDEQLQQQGLAEFTTAQYCHF